MKPTIFKPRMGQDNIQHPLCLLVECNLLDLNRNQIFNVMWSKTSILCADLGPGRWGTVWCGYLLRRASSQVWISLNETEFLSHVAIATCPSPCIMTDASMLWFGSTPNYCCGFSCNQSSINQYFTELRCISSCSPPQLKD